MWQRVVGIVLATILLLPCDALARRKSKKRTRAKREKITCVANANQEKDPKCASLSGKKDDSLRWQNLFADRDGLERLEDEEDLKRLVRAGLLVPLPENQHLAVDKRIDKKGRHYFPPEYRFSLPQARVFLLRLGKDHYEKFGKQLQVNSAVRTEEYQRRLRRGNRNAAKPEGEKASSHLTGATVDITKKGMSRSERKWMQKYLLVLEREGFIEVIEESLGQDVFHIMVRKKLLGGGGRP